MVAAASERASTKVQSVASASEELSCPQRDQPTGSGISPVANEAVQQGRATNERVCTLSTRHPGRRRR